MELLSMKKLFFYGNINIKDQSIGITRKVMSQIKTLRNMGFEVYYTGYDKNGVSIFNNKDEIVRFDKYWTASEKINRYLRRWNLLHTATKFVSESKVKFDYAYLRFHFFDQKYLNLLKKLNKEGAKVIIEAHGYPYKSKKISPLTLIYILDSLYEPLVRKYIDIVAAISNHKDIWKCKTVQIDNAINLEDINLQKKIIDSKSIRLISVSNEKDYHGYPKIIKGLSDYYKSGGSRNIKVFFVGEYKGSTKNMVVENKLSDHIIFLGKKHGQELEDVYRLADLGVGAFGFHAGSEYGSSIKTKEYFALGLPFINGWKEYAFDDYYPYVKRFDLNSDIIDFEEVVTFYDYIIKDEQIPLKMREFAKINYTWEAQFGKIFTELDLNTKG